VIGEARGVGDGGQNVLGFKKRVIRENFLVAGVVTQEIEDIRDAYAFAPNAGLSAAFTRLDCYPFQQVHGLKVPRRRTGNKREKATSATGEASKLRDTRIA